MRVNLSQFLRLSRADKAKVTHLDLSCDEDIPYRNSELGDSEEFPGEALARRTDERGFNHD